MKRSSSRMNSLNLPPSPYQLHKSNTLLFNKTREERSYCTIEIFTILKKFMRKENLFDQTNFSFVNVSPELEEAINVTVSIK
jgi:hypothetical protein